MNTEIKTKDGVIYLWFDNFYIEKRNKGFSKESIERSEVKNRIRDLFPKAVLEHEEGGAPLLINAEYPYISISHYRGWYALYFSKIRNGVDIQTFKNTLDKGKDYFINLKDNELDLTTTNLHLIWSAKEAFYKKKRGNIIDLKNEVAIKEINLDVGFIVLDYKGLKSNLDFRIFKDFVIVWT